jgi:hypothetical protein
MPVMAKHLFFETISVANRSPPFFVRVTDLNRHRAKAKGSLNISNVLSGISRYLSFFPRLTTLIPMQINARLRVEAFSLGVQGLSCFLKSKLPPASISVMRHFKMQSKSFGQDI